MPGPAIQAVTTPQWGLEANTAPGAPSAIVVATKKLAAQDMLIKPTDTVIREPLLKGLAMKNRGNEVIGERGLDWEVPETPLIFDEFHYWEGMAIVGPTKTGAGPFVWTATHTPATIQARHLRSFEYDYFDGTNHVAQKFGAGYLRELEIIGAANSVVKYRAAGSGRRIQAMSPITPALSLPAIQEVPMALSKVFIDSAWGSLGSTQITGQIVGWRWKLNTGLFDQNTADGRSDQDFSVVVLDPEELVWTLEIDVKANLNTGQWQTEKTAAEALTLRAVRIQASITGAVAYDLKIDGLYKYTLGSVFPQDRNNGEVMCKLALEASTDDTNTFALTTTNNVTAAIA